MPDWLRKRKAAISASGGTAVEASVSLDTVRRAYYDEIDATPGTMWWWIREVRINPLTLIVDDDEGHLFEVPVTVDASDNIAFGDPTEVKIQYVAASGHPIVARPTGQIIAATHGKPEDTGRKPRASAPEDTTVVPSSTITEGQENLLLTDEELAALGLEPGATREQISAAILGQTAGGTPDGDPAPETQPETPATEPEAQPTPAPEPETPETPAAPEGVVVPEGMVLVDAATMEEMRTGVAAAQGLVTRQENADRDAILDTAIRAGKFGKGRRDHYEALLKSDPIGGKATIAALEPGLVPVAETGEAGGDEVAAAEQTAYPAGWGRSVAAARKGLGDRVKVVAD